MNWNPKRKAIAFASVLVLVSTAMVGTAVAATGSALRPFLTDQQYGHERGLSRGHMGFGVAVRQIVGDALQPVEGAEVGVVRLTPDGERPADVKETNERGAAVFNLRPGPYRVTVTKDSLLASEEFRVRHGVRVVAVFDEDGQATWRQADHRPMERRGDTVGLVVRVGERTEDGLTPIGGAIVEIRRYTDRNTTEHVATLETNDRGMAAFQLHRGPYLVTVTAGDTSNHTSLRLDGGKIVYAILDGDDLRFRVGSIDDHRRPSGSPSPSRPARGG